VITARTLFASAAALMVVDAIGYSIGALGPLQRILGPTDPYLKRRLTLNLLLANQGLYFAGFAAWVGVVYVNSQPQAAKAIELLCFLTCIYTLVTVPVLTPRDWPHVLPRGLAAVLISAAWMLG
jgi:hypothetical protein